MNKITIFIIIISLSLAGCNSCIRSGGNSALEQMYNPIPMSIFEDSVHHARAWFENYEPPYPVYHESQIAGIAETMLVLQNKDGGWPKNVDWYIKLDDTNLEITRTEMIMNGEGGGRSTFDNRTTYSHIDYLARVYAQIPGKKYKAAIEKAIEWVLSVQNKDSRGFAGIDVDAVTYNDDVMTGVLHLLREIASSDSLYRFLDSGLRKKALTAYEQGLECILKSQVRVDGKLTAWGQQHDHKTLQPVWARDYEPPSITANESVGVISLLMEIENPLPEVRNAVGAGCEWLDKVKIHGKKLTWKSVSGQTIMGRKVNYEKVLVDDPLAPDLWCRFYDLQGEQPLLYDRGKRKVNRFNELSLERRNGYHYFGTWPGELLQHAYPQWRRRVGLDE